MSIWDYIMVPFGYIMKFGYDFLGNYGLALFLYALVTKILLFPLSMKQQKSQLGMVRMRPYQEQLMKKYGNNKQKYQEELMRLYEREGYSPMSSCLPTLIQLPIIMLIYNIVRRPLSYIAGWDLEKLKEMAKPVVEANADAFKNIGENLERVKDFELQLMPYLQESGAVDINTKFLGIDLTRVPSEFKEVGWVILLIPAVAGITSWLVSFVSQKLNAMTTPADQQSAGSLRMMNIVMPLLSLWMSYTFTAGLGVYWIASNILAIGQTFILHRMYDPKKVLAEVEEKIAREKEAEKEKRRAAAEKRALSNNKNSKKKRAMKAQITAENNDGVTDTEKEN